jgi:alpha-mannosidase
MDLYKDYKFCQSQAILYEWVKNSYPTVYNKIKEKIIQGQWIPVGNSFILI